MIGRSVSDWVNYALHTHANGYGRKCKPATYSAALGHILQHFATTPMPATLCPNCFTHHLPHPCRLPRQDFRSHLLQSHPTCSVCLTRHPPPYPCVAFGLDPPTPAPSPPLPAIAYHANPATAIGSAPDYDHQLQLVEQLGEPGAREALHAGFTPPPAATATPDPFADEAAAGAAASL